MDCRYGRGVKLSTGFKSTVTVIVFGAALSRLPTVAYSQEEDSDRLATAEARLDKLEESVADLEGRLAALEGAPNTAVPSEQGAPTPSPVAVAPGESSRDQPIPIGESAKVGDWILTVDSVNPAADELILSENTFNEPPDPGYQFFMVTLSMTYDGAESAQPSSELSFKAVGASNVAYDEFSPGCGVVPLDLSLAGEVFTGGTIEGNVCFAVKSEDASSVVMYVEPFFSMDDLRTWFSLNDDIEPGDG
jgi:hypothetical protein